MELILLQGCPGSGKSTLVDLIVHDLHWEDYSVCSTDKFWYQDDPTIYQFNGERIGEAHRWNQRRVNEEMIEGTPLVIVDNTNIKKKDVQIYLEMAAEHGYGVQVYRADPGVEECVRRNAERSEDRRVPEEIVRRMHASMENLL